MRTTTSKLLKNLKFRQSVSHSIGYDDEYEIASAPLSSYNSSISALSWGNSELNNSNKLFLPSVGENEKFIPIDYEDNYGEDNNKKDGREDKNNDNTVEDSVSLQKQMLELTRF
jgi:hypothetical protein